MQNKTRENYELPSIIAPYVTLFHITSHVIVPASFVLLPHIILLMCLVFEKESLTREGKTLSTSLLLNIL